MKVAHIIMPNSAKVSLMLRFPFLTIQEQGKSLFIGKKKSATILNTKKLIQPLHSQAAAYGFTLVQDRPRHALPDRPASIPPPWPRAPRRPSARDARRRPPAAAAPAGHAAGLGQWVCYLYGWFHCLLPRDSLEVTLSVR